MFEDRVDAGDRLAEAVRKREPAIDIVLAIPRGGLPLGRAVADALGVPLDVVVAKKIGAPWNPELAIGAVASDGSEWRNEALIERAGVEEASIANHQRREAEAAREKADRYRSDRSALDLRGKRVLLVDDGVATGATTRACLTRLRNAGVARVELAVPVGPPNTIERLGSEADTVICLETPSQFDAVGQFYRSFEQVSDEEAIGYLDRSSRH